MIEKLDTASSGEVHGNAASGCVMAAAGFYEWQVQPDGTKQPYYVQPGADSDVLAALWDRSRTAAGEDLLSCTIITMPANELLAEIHNAKRGMPLILS
jgi:putative SOS response-associated peptidase YedK